MVEMLEIPPTFLVLQDYLRITCWLFGFENHRTYCDGGLKISPDDVSIVCLYHTNQKGKLIDTESESGSL